MGKKCSSVEFSVCLSFVIKEPNFCYRGYYRLLYITPEFTEVAHDLLRDLHQKVGKNNILY